MASVLSSLVASISVVACPATRPVSVTHTPASPAAFVPIRPCFPSNPLTRFSSAPAPRPPTTPLAPPPTFWGGGLKEVIEFLTPTIHRDTITSPLLETIATPFRSSLHQFPYAVPSTMHPFLQTCGINASSFGYKAHPHPVHKTIELHLLFDVWTALATTPSSVMFMKPSKFAKLQTKNPNFAELHNYRLTPRDTTRYPETSQSLPTTDTAFMHDALMYFTPAQILDFFTRCPKLQKLYASLVVPAESSFTGVSLFPELYRFRLSGPNLVYELEGNPAHNYTQPAGALSWLQTTTIQGPEFSLSISRLDSWGPVHHLLIQRGLPPVHARHDELDFRVPAAILLPEASSLHQPIRDRLVPKAVYEAIFIYVRAVRTLRTTDPAGFVRTQSNKPEHSWVTASAWDNLAHFALMTASHRPHTTYYLFDSTLSKVAHWARTHTLFLQGITAACLTPLASLSALGLAHFSRCRISALSLFGHWLVCPDFYLLKPKAPLFRLAVAPASAPFRAFKGTFLAFDVFPRLTQDLLHRVPLLRRFFPRRPLPNACWWACLAAASIPVFLWACRWFVGPDSPQHMHDAYHELFHPELWRLTLRRSPLATSAERFLPIETFTPPEPTPPTPAQEATAAETPVLAPAIPASTAPSPPRPLPTPEPVQALQNASPAPAPPAQLTSLSSLPTPAPRDTVIPLASTAPIAELTAPTAPIAEPSAPAPTDDRPEDFAPPLDPSTVDAALLALGISIPSSDIVLPPSPAAAPEPIMPPNSLVQSSFGSVAAPVSSLPAPTPLESDPTAAGPISMFSELFPASYLGTSGSFLCRRRASGRCSLPYPAMDCLLVTVSEATHIPREDLWSALCVNLPDSMLDADTIRARGLSTDHLVVLARFFNFRATLDLKPNPVTYGLSDSPVHFHITYTPESHTADGFKPGHFALSTARPANLNGGLAPDLATAALRFNTGGALLPFHTVHTYTTQPARAKNLISNMKNGFDGILASIDPAHPSEARARLLTLDGVMDVASPRSVRLIHLAGFAGCGKSYPVSRLLKTATFKDFKLSVPTTELRNEWKGILNLPAGSQWRLSTWESSLLKSARILVIDEIYKMPRGYLDLCIHADPTVEFVIALGDPLQGEYHSISPSSSNSRLSSEVRHLAPFIDYYCMWSRRIPKLVADFFQLPTLSSEPGFTRLIRHLPSQAKILTNSQNSSRVLNDCGRASTTIASSQGSTYDGPSYILLDRHTALLSPAHSLVALTRSKVGIIFVGDVAQLHGGPTCNRLLSDFWAGRKVSIPGLFADVLPPSIFLSAPLTSRQRSVSGAGASPAPAWTPCSLRNGPESPPPSPYGCRLPIRGPNDPSVKSTEQRDVISHAPIVLGDGSLNAPQVSTHFLPETRRPLHFDLPSAVCSSASLSPAAPTATAIEPVYPGETFENLLAHFLPPHSPEDREITYRGQLSNQFPHINRPFELAAQPSSLLAAIHNEKNDPTLLAASIQKRLRFRPSDAPYQLTSKDEILGSLLYEAWCEAYHRSPSDTVPFDPVLFAECIALNEYAQLSSKTQSVIIANASRSDPDWRWSVVRIFSKTQHKVNENSIFGSWKACQTLALMHDAVVLILGPVKKYQRIFDAQDRPSTLYVHAGNTPPQMSAWCQANLTSAVKLANDYTAFDQSQHGEAVVFERKKMERLSIPQDLIDLHLHLKTHVSTQFGPLTCMRLTGEPGTYDDNTDYNLAVINLEYFAQGVPTMVSGDDSVLDFEPPRRPTWPAISKLLALRFKKESGKYITFCGFYVGTAGIVRSPIALFAKLAIATDDASMDDKLASYLTEFVVGHSLGDALWSLLPVEAVPFQSACFDFFCRHAPPALKLALRIGEVPEATLALLANNTRWASGAVFSLLPAAIRYRLLHSKFLTRSLPESPDVTALQGELLHMSQLNQSSMHPDTLLPLHGGSSSNILPTPAIPSLPIIPASMANASLTQVGPAPAADSRIDAQPSLPRAPRLLESSVPVYIDYPFQWQIASYTGSASAFITDDLSASPTLKKVMAGYRHAELLHVELEFSPLQPSFSKPVSLSAVWTISSCLPTEGTETSFYGGRVFTIGGPVLMSSTTVLPADLNRLNPVILSPVAFTDCPRYSYTIYKCDSSNTSNLVSVLIRGVVRLSGPSGAKLT